MNHFMNQILENVIDGIGALSTLGTAVIGWLALDSWKKVRKAELAEEIIISINELKGLIEWTRSPAGYDNEGKTRTQDYGEHERNSLKDSYFRCIERLRNERHLLTKVPVLKLKSSLHFSDLKIAEELDVFLQVVREIQSASHRLIVGGNKKRQEFENKIWSTSDKDDEITLRINDATSKIESALRKFL